MSEEILINVTPQETRVAVLENGILQEIHIERSRKRGLVGNVYKGKVSRILPGMQAAFIEVGLDRTAFLHASDIAVDGENQDETPQINTLLHEGQDVLVQVIKDPMGTKGARLTTELSIPSRLLVYMPGISHVGISQKIEGEEERDRLKDIVKSLMESTEEKNGYIVRTVAEGANEEELSNDMRFLQRLWSSVQKQVPAIETGTIVYEDLPLAVRVLRDMVGIDVEKVRIDSREMYRKATEFANQFIPELAECIEHYPGERPIFDLYSVEDEIQKALERKVQLKSGGHLVFDQTEAMTTIDVNTGAFVGHRNMEETIFKTNLEAAQAIARQLQLRNLGGIIILDFIDMQEEEHKRQVLRALEKSLNRDRSKSHICEVSGLGLVEMTRKRTRESLEHILCQPCPTCQARASIKTAETVCYEIFREILREARQFDTQTLMVLASQEVVDLLLDEESDSVAELEEFISKTIKFQVESLYKQEQFDIILM